MLFFYSLVNSQEKKINSSGLIVALDTVNDPGNLGTIIRLCDWFGVEQLVCSKDTVDCYNSNVVQATMGSLTRVSISYLNLPEYLQTVSLETFLKLSIGKNTAISHSVIGTLAIFPFTCLVK